ncbi:condensation domain-containing protein [Pedobacter cryoconitis]|uniref:Condensation domain-containing protein n=1 Tax=Pedobacter cryoconitis TaxID=188932 RepID=A0A7X0J0Y3_9SPHI|nr:condensation domain-containing protein [Pedobacter cryoconitis]MBB6499056.1 hypothetical protein [Pedobacter cryoconitis]
MEEEIYEASASQLQSWLYQKSGKPAKLLSLRFLKKNVNVPVLKKSIASVIKRHETLRTSFIFSGGRLIQQVSPYDRKHFEVILHDLKEVKDTDFEINLITEEGNKCLQNLQSIPLIKAYIFELADETFIFRFYLNPIIADIPSLSLLKNDINLFYGAYINDNEPELPDLKIQFKDYIRQYNKVYLNKKESLKKFWNDSIGDLSKVINWEIAFNHYTYSTSNPVNNLKITDKESISNVLEKDNTAEFGLKLGQMFYDGLEDISAYTKTGISSTLYTSLFILFYLIDDQKDVLIASPVSLRATTPVLSSIIANFDASIYLRGSLSDDQKFLDVLTKTYTDFIKCCRKAITSHKNLDLDTGVLRTNCSAYLNFQHKGITGKPNKVEFSEGHKVYGSTYYMLTYEVTQIEDGYDCKWYYNTSIFPALFIEWMALVHKEILEAVINDQHITIKALKNKLNLFHP